MRLRFWQRKGKDKPRSKEWLAGYAAGRRARNRQAFLGEGKTVTIPQFNDVTVPELTGDVITPEAPTTIAVDGKLFEYHEPQ